MLFLGMIRLAQVAFPQAKPRPFSAAPGEVPPLPGKRHSAPPHCPGNARRRARSGQSAHTIGHARARSALAASDRAAPMLLQALCKLPANRPQLPKNRCRLAAHRQQKASRFQWLALSLPSRLGGSLPVKNVGFLPVARVNQTAWLRTGVYQVGFPRSQPCCSLPHL